MNYFAILQKYLAKELVKKRQRNPPNQQPYFDLIEEEPEIPDFMKPPSDEPEANDLNSDSESNSSDSDSDISFVMSDITSENEDEPALTVADLLENSFSEE